MAPQAPEPRRQAWAAAADRRLGDASSYDLVREPAEAVEVVGGLGRQGVAARGPTRGLHPARGRRSNSSKRCAATIPPPQVTGGSKERELEAGGLN